MKVASQQSTRNARAIMAGAMAAGVLSLIPLAAEAQGITYTLAPAVSSIQWDKDFGLKNHSLYGGQASIDFERLISLQAFLLHERQGEYGGQQTWFEWECCKSVEGSAAASTFVWARTYCGSSGQVVLLRSSKRVAVCIELRPDSGKATKQIMFDGWCRTSVRCECPGVSGCFRR